jgi:hypothetical protein
MTGHGLLKLITENGKKIIYKNTEKESYLYESGQYLIELYYDSNLSYSRGIRVFHTTSENKYNLVHSLRGTRELELCNNLFYFLNGMSNLWDTLSIKVEESKINA